MDGLTSCTEYAQNLATNDRWSYIFDGPTARSGCHDVRGS